MESLGVAVQKLNTEKNKYAEKKIKSGVSETEDKEIISQLIYVISQCRATADEMGISTDGKYSKSNSEMENFRGINIGISNLKSQILILVNSPRDDLKQMVKNERDLHNTSKENGAKSNNRDVIARKKLSDKLNKINE